MNLPNVKKSRKNILCLESASFLHSIFECFFFIVFLPSELLSHKLEKSIRSITETHSSSSHRNNQIIFKFFVVCYIRPTSFLDKTQPILSTLKLTDVDFLPFPFFQSLCIDFWVSSSFAFFFVGIIFRSPHAVDAFAFSPFSRLFCANLFQFRIR